MKLFDLFKNKKLTKIDQKNLAVKIDKKQLEKLTGGLASIDQSRKPIFGKIESKLS